MGSTGENPAGLPERQLLESWKEIAAHFGVTTRTAQMWELERGLPVRRKPGPKGRVFAYQDELDAWTSDHDTAPWSDSVAEQAPATASSHQADSGQRALLPPESLTAPASDGELLAGPLRGRVGVG